MESPVKKLDFSTANKENLPADASLESTTTDIIDQKPIAIAAKKDPKDDGPAVAPGIKADEAHEPILAENAQRFVLFPIKYHEVCLDAFLRVK